MVRMIALLIGISLLSVSGLGLVQLAHAEHGTGCMFTMGEISICPMSGVGMTEVFSMLARALPLDFINLLLLLACTASLASAFFLIASHVPPKKQRINITPTYRHIDLYTILFSKGILHPKAP